jgi:hypothetical protein
MQLFSLWQFIYVWHAVHDVKCCPLCAILFTGNILPLLCHFVHKWQFARFMIFCLSVTFPAQLTHLSRESYGTSLGMGGLGGLIMWWSDPWGYAVCSACDSSSMCDMLSTMWHVVHSVTSCPLVTFCPSVYMLSTLWHLSSDNILPLLCHFVHLWPFCHSMHLSTFKICPIGKINELQTKQHVYPKNPTEHCCE